MRGSARMRTVLVLSLGLACSPADPMARRSFDSPEEAAQALWQSIEADDRDAVLELFGRAYADRLVTPDWDSEREARQR